MVVAWSKSQSSGYIIDYGSFPDQRSSFYTLSNLRHTIGKAYRLHGSSTHARNETHWLEDPQQPEQGW
jgi:hypothetical protein